MWPHSCLEVGAHWLCLTTGVSQYTCTYAATVRPCVKGCYLLSRGCDGGLHSLPPPAEHVPTNQKCQHRYGRGYRSQHMLIHRG